MSEVGGAVMIATRAHQAALAAIHETAFPPREAWDEAAMGDILGMPGMVGFLHPAGGMLLVRVVQGEGEILTFAVAPPARRRGVGRALLEQAVGSLGPMPWFLEVAASNRAARGLYAEFAFVECGCRRDYYGRGHDALVMRRSA